MLWYAYIKHLHRTKRPWCSVPLDYGPRVIIRITDADTQYFQPSALVLNKVWFHYSMRGMLLKSFTKDMGKSAISWRGRFSRVFIIYGYGWHFVTSKGGVVWKIWINMVRYFWVWIQIPPKCIVEQSIWRYCADLAIHQVAGNNVTYMNNVSRNGMTRIRPSCTHIQSFDAPCQI